MKKWLPWLLAIPALIAAVVIIVIVLVVVGDDPDTTVDIADPATASVGDTSDVADAADAASDAATDPDRPCLGEPDPGMNYEVGYRVVAGRLGAVCFGDADSTAEGAWQILSDIAPAGQLQDLSSFTGFRLDQGDTLAFVAASDATGSTFEMAVNLDETEDRWELNLTMLHEFSHVFTATPNELDRSVDEEDCETYWNSEGCYWEGSLMADWVQTFWADEVGSFDPTADETDNGSEQRCALNPGFFGSYAATSPEEDFAEAFSAFVFRIAADTPAQQERLDWIGALPGLVEFRDRATDRGYEAQLNYFALCGSAAGG